MKNIYIEMQTKKITHTEARTNQQPGRWRPASTPNMKALSVDRPEAADRSQAFSSSIRGGAPSPRVRSPARRVQKNSLDMYSCQSEKQKPKTNGRMLALPSRLSEWEHTKSFLQIQVPRVLRPSLLANKQSGATKLKQTLGRITAVQLKLGINSESSTLGGVEEKQHKQKANSHVISRPEVSPGKQAFLLGLVTGQKPLLIPPSPWRAALSGSRERGLSRGLGGVQRTQGIKKKGQVREGRRSSSMDRNKPMKFERSGLTATRKQPLPPFYGNLIPDAWAPVDTATGLFWTQGGSLVTLRKHRAFNYLNFVSAYQILFFCELSRIRSASLYPNPPMGGKTKLPKVGSAEKKPKYIQRNQIFLGNDLSGESSLSSPASSRAAFPFSPLDSRGASRDRKLNTPLGPSSSYSLSGRQGRHGRQGRQFVPSPEAKKHSGVSPSWSPTPSIENGQNSLPAARREGHPRGAERLGQSSVTHGAPQSTKVARGATGTNVEQTLTALNSSIRGCSLEVFFEVKQGNLTSFGI